MDLRWNSDDSLYWGLTVDTVYYAFQESSIVVQCQEGNIYVREDNLPSADEDNHSPS